MGPVDKKEQSDGGFRATLPSRRKVYFCRFVPFSPFWAEIGDKTAQPLPSPEEPVLCQLASPARWRGCIMSCLLCASRNQAEFGTEILIHFSGIANLDKPPVWVFPKLLVCLDCGASCTTSGMTSANSALRSWPRSSGFARNRLPVRGTAERCKKRQLSIPESTTEYYQRSSSLVGFDQGLNGK